VGIKQLMEFFYTFFRVLAWSFSKGEKVVILDILIIKIAFPTLLAVKLCGIKCVTIVTDIPFHMSILSLNKKVSLKKCIDNYIFNMLANHYDGYVLLTEQMNELVNRKLRPYIIMEGLVDSSDSTVEDIPKSSKKIVLYAGSLFDVFGVKNLIEAFILLKDKNAELHLYGQGPMVKDISEYYCKQDNRIKFFGVVPSEEVVVAEHKATLLVNPRSNKYEYTKYSFPSKNMEYMVSGTPLLGMLLPGMNKEYADYMFLITDESTETLAKTLENILCMEPDALIQKGESAKNFVLTNKNNIQQAARILDLINKI
ncbi:MAG: glycosyltransferase, partial [Victivallaceae bacterium]|nr:glycosyltransferase [Victivallaceae bacterium]